MTTYATNQLIGSFSSTPENANRWMATLAHELRNPLNSITLALDELHPICEEDPAAREARDAARHGAGQITQIIEEVIEFYNGRRPTLTSIAQPVNLHATAAAAIRAAGPLLDECGHVLAVSIPPDPVLLKMPASQIEQILTNLLSNAAKYTDDGGRIWLTIEAIGGELILRVRDDGIGISRQMLPHVFDAFWRDARLRVLSREGSGIGLAVVKTLVDAQGGSVVACSEGVGKGSEFVVRVPCV